MMARLPFLKKIMGRTEFKEIRGINEFRAHMDEFIASRAAFAIKTAEKNRSASCWHISGYCEVCDRPASFLIDWQYSDNLYPNFRERMVCSYCGLNLRQRFMAAYMRKMAGRKSIYMYEQTTFFYKKMQDLLDNSVVSGSEYLGFDKTPGAIINGVRHEDAMQLSFDDGSFDIIVSNDVFEHVPDIAKTLGEACRVLKRNGILLLSMPFYADRLKTVERAKIADGGVVHLLPEQYHGNPVDEKGSLVFYDFGWDFFDCCKNAGFSDIYMLAYHSISFGYISNQVQFVFIAAK